MLQKIMEKENRLIVGIGTGWPDGDAESCNAISAGIATAVDLLAREKSGEIFLVGGNGVIAGNGVRGLPEAFRMAKLISARPISTDCDEGSDLIPSRNTPTNARNVAVHLRKKSVNYCDVVAAKQHLLRVIGCLRKEFHKVGVIDDIQLTGYPMSAPFEKNNAQKQLRSREKFRKWTLKANVYHLFAGHVLRWEYIKMLLGEMPEGVKIDERFLKQN